MYSSMFICPICKNILNTTGKSLVCENKHCFDISKSGYVNLLTSSAGGRHGDDKLMVKARSEFLNKDYYKPLANKIVKGISALEIENPLIIDAGCGEGYYTQSIENAFNCTLIGIDISKFALTAAAKRCRNTHFAVASTSAMPVQSERADIVLNIFSPLFADEFHRVLKDDGYLLRVVPMEKHLLELKQAIYDTAYENPAPDVTLSGFETIKAEPLKYKIHLSDNASINQLFMMTPYYYKTGKDDQMKLENMKSIDISAEFCIMLYKKCSRL